MAKHTYDFIASGEATRLDLFVASQLPNFSRSYIQLAIKNNTILVNGKPATKNTIVGNGEQVAVWFITSDFIENDAEPLEITIAHEDENVLVVDKTPGVVCHPGAGVSHGTLLQGLLYAYPYLRQVPRGGLVHRLDKDTSGLLLVAKHLEAHDYLTKLLQRREIKREYRGIVYGTVISGSTINLPLARDSRNRLKRKVVEGGKEAITHFRVLHRLAGATELLIQLESGRTHQIRAHFEAKSMSLVGDKLYGKKHVQKGLKPEARDSLLGFNRVALHAWRLSWKPFGLDSEIVIESTLPDDYQKLLQTLSP
ncbi:MAG: RluA family pseudouridine synthase [Methylacidiphilales bacterium]|nr:RluA family pseudouridine synthase [Candidatus Methylacidiphilales bacterium]